MSKNQRPKNKVTDYQKFLNSYKITKEDGLVPTNTRITGGSFHIPDDKYSNFLDLYYNGIVSRNEDEYLTEKQRKDDGPIAIDFDFRYEYNIDTKKYNLKHITDVIDLFLKELKKIYTFDEEKEFPIFVFEKPNVNRLEKKNLTKDGIHMIIGIQSDRITQEILRKRIIEQLSEIWSDIPLINSWEDVYDQGITAGSVNWQLYGSKKPDHEKYDLTNVFTYKFDESDDEFSEIRTTGKGFDWKNDFKKLSIRYTGHPQYFYKVNFAVEHDNFNKNSPSKPITTGDRIKVNENMDLSALIKSKEDIDKGIGEFLDNLLINEYEMREAYELVMILPVKYYGNGSYDRWIRVGWALANISKKMLIVWIAFSARSESFCYNDISEICERWSQFNVNNGLRKGSIMMWAKQDAQKEYKKIHENSVDYYLNQSIKNISLLGISKNEKNLGCGDADIAKILYILYKDSFACAALKADKWFRYSKHRWVEDESGTSLRRNISEELRNLYRKKCDEFSQKLCDKGQTDENIKKYENLANKVLEIIIKLGQTTHKDHILKEAREMFYDPDVKFMDLLDSNPYLMCFNNGVIDFKTKEFRPGRADDYLEKCTNIDYKPIDENRDAKKIAEINDFMEKLFPIPELRKYMWQHLASLLIGVNLNQKLHLYIGAGENGKSVLTDLLSQCLGDYYAIVPISLITQQRQKQGQASPDIVALKGLRFAVMQEPSKDDKINDGAMKELTSGVEPIKGRNLFSSPITFVPQCKIAVCSNNFMKVTSQDHGTWRRMAVVDFMSLFTNDPQEGDKEKPFQYKKDTTLKEKFPEWKETFIAMLVDIAFKKDGNVDVCELVENSSMKYKEREDHIAEFIREKIQTGVEGKITKTEVNNEFSIWYMGTYGRGGPSTKEVHEYLDKRIGKYNTKSGGWVGARIKYDNDISDDSDDDDSIINNISVGDL